MGEVTLSQAETQEAGPAKPSTAALTSEDVRFLQERLALFAIVLTGLSVAGLVMVLGLDFVMGLMHHVWVAHVLHVAAVFASFGAWLVLRGPTRSERWVKTADIVFTLGTATTMHVMCSRFPIHARPDLIASLVAMLVTLGRAIIVPSSPRRTFWISTISWLPLFPLTENRVASAAELVTQLRACSVADTWTNDDARTWWQHRKKGPAPPASKREETSWSAKTIAVDLAR